MPEYFKVDSYNMVLLLAGLIALLAATVPVIMERKYFSAPMVYLLLGVLACAIGFHYQIEPLEHMELVKRVTEFVVIVALANAGLKIRKSFKWHTWKYSIRLLAIAMPITIIAAAYLGIWIAGLVPAAAMLFGALISPTDPVLAAELQTSQPSEDDTSKVKLGLTAEAGMNDGLAFPFTYLAIMAVEKGMDIEEWFGEWFIHYFMLKIIIGVGVGLLVGWLLFKVVFSISSHDMLSKISRGIISLALILLPYAITETIGGYGFIAVFVAACMFSNYEEHDEHMDSLHDFNEELESMVVALLFIGFGVFIAAHYEIIYDVRILSVALLMVLVVRPVAGFLSLIKTDLNYFQKFVLSFYGIRGIGSLFYLAYAFTSTDFKNKNILLDLTIATIFFSMLIHGVTARFIQKRIKKYDHKQPDGK